MDTGSSRKIKSPLRDGQEAFVRRVFSPQAAAATF